MAPPEKQVALVDTGKRKVACTECRYGKRTCVYEADAGRQRLRCKRCTQRGLVCELPTAKGLAQPTLPYRTSVPSPTSTISEITNFHLSTALQWHLLDLSSRHGLRPVEGFAYSKKDLRQFRNMIVDPLDKVEDRRKEQETELVALVHLLQAARISTHSAIVGETGSATFDVVTPESRDEPLQPLGTRRKQAIHTVQQRVQAQLDELTQPSDIIAEEVNRLAFLHAIQWKCHATNTSIQVHKDCGLAVKRGVKLLGKGRAAEPYRDEMLKSLEDWTLIHTNCAARSNFPLMVTEQECLLFTPKPPPPHSHGMHDLSPAELNKLLSSTAPEAPLFFQNAFDAPLLYLHNTYALILVAATPPPLSTVLECASAINAVLLAIDLILARLLTPLAQTSPSPFMGELFGLLPRLLSWTVMLPGLLFGCHRRIAEMAGLDVSRKELLLEQSRRRIAEVFRRAADYMGYILALNLSPAHRLDGVYPWPILMSELGEFGISVADEWLRLDPVRRQSLLRMLRFNAFSLHTACTVLAELEGSGVLDDPAVTTTADAMVEGALRDVLDGSGGGVGLG